MSERGSRLGSFVLGGIVGGLAGVAAGWLRARPGDRRAPGAPGLAAFEEAPCFHELRQEQQSEAKPASDRGETVLPESALNFVATDSDD